VILFIAYQQYLAVPKFNFLKYLIMDEIGFFESENAVDWNCKVLQVNKFGIKACVDTTNQAFIFLVGVLSN
jgi:hypothetical protein